MVRELGNGVYPAGRHSVHGQAGDAGRRLSSGIYYVRMKRLRDAYAKARLGATDVCCRLAARRLIARPFASTRFVSYRENLSSTPCRGSCPIHLGSRPNAELQVNSNSFAR